MAFLALLHPILLFKKWVTCALRICSQHFVANKRMSAANPAQAVLCGDVFEEIFGASVSKCICVLQLIVDDLELFPEACRKKIMCRKHTETIERFYPLSIKEGDWMRLCLNGCTFLGEV